MLPKSNARRAPSDERSSSARRLASRSSRSRLKSTRASQSTPMLPRVAILIAFSLPVMRAGGALVESGQSGDAPAAVDVEAVRRDAAVEQQELGRVDDVRHRRELATG